MRFALFVCNCVYGKNCPWYMLLFPILDADAMQKQLDK